jgi:hypothetical protein
MKIVSKLLLIIVACMSLSIHAIAQEDLPKTVERASNNFYSFEIPAAINGSNINPSPFSALSFDLTDSKLAFKYGFPHLEKTPVRIDSVRNYGFIQGNIRATTGIATLFKPGDTPFGYGISSGWSHIIKNKYWVYTANPTDISSQNVQWFSIRADVQRENYNIFNETATFGTINQETTDYLYSFFASYNSFFYSEIKRYKKSNHILTGGLGVARTNNYNSLKKRTLDEGVIRYSDDGTTYKSVVKTTDGASGEFRTYQGVTAFVEAYVPLYRKSGQKTSIYLGGRGTWYGVFKNENIINASGGLFANVKKKLNGEDLLNLALAGRFNNLNDVRLDNYWQDNFSVILSTSIPIRFR